MKKYVFLLAASMASVAFAGVAGPITTNSNDVGLYAQDDREKIKPESLPEPVKTTLNGDEYKGWLIDAAYRYKAQDVYEVELKKGAETKTIKFDKDGKVVV